MNRYGYDAGELVQVTSITINLTDAEIALALCRRSTSSISASPGTPLPPEEPVPLQSPRRGKSALRFEPTSAPTEMAPRMFVQIFDPLTADNPFVSTVDGLGFYWDTVLASDPTALLVVVVIENNNSTPGTIVFQPLDRDDFITGDDDQFGTTFLHGSTEVTGSVTAINVPDETGANAALNPPSGLDIWPLTGGDSEILPKMFCRDPVYAITTAGIEVTFGGVGRLRIAAMFTGSDGAAYDTLKNGVAVTTATTSAVAVSPQTGTNSLTGWAQHPYKWGMDGSPADPGDGSGNFTSAVTTGGSWEFRAFDSHGVVTATWNTARNQYLAPFHEGEAVNANLSFSASGSEADFSVSGTVSGGGIGFTLTADGTNAPYTGLTVTMSVTVGGFTYGDGDDLLPAATTSLTLAFV
jgi:hypothetical protein